MTPRERATEILKENPGLTASQLVRKHREHYGKGLDYKLAQDLIKEPSDGEVVEDISLKDIDVAITLVKELGGVKRTRELFGIADSMGGPERFRMCFERIAEIQESLS